MKHCNRDIETVWISFNKFPMSYHHYQQYANRILRHALILLLMLTCSGLQAQRDRVYTSLSEVQNPDEVYVLHLNYKRLKHVPPQIFTFTNLVELDLSKNMIDSIPPAIGRLSNLTTLNLCRNKIHSLPDSIGRLTELKVLNASRNPILDMPETLGLLVNLEELILNMTGVVSLPATCFTLNYSLQVIDLRACPLTYDDQVAIEELLPSPRKRWNYVCNCK